VNVTNPVNVATGKISRDLLRKNPEKVFFISRFAINTSLLLQVVRELKDINVEVKLEKENISTLSGDGELMLTVLASFAQEESNGKPEDYQFTEDKLKSYKVTNHKLLEFQHGIIIKCELLTQDLAKHGFIKKLRLENAALSNLGFATMPEFLLGSSSKLIFSRNNSQFTCTRICNIRGGILYERDYGDQDQWQNCECSTCSGNTHKIWMQHKDQSWISRNQ
jgi:hypothetical protein